MFDKVRIVMVNTTHPGNIGAAARAMKTMGLSRLYLVEPKEFPHSEATFRASGASDLLATAVVVPTLADAIADCQLVIGTSARDRRIPWPMMNARECGTTVAQEMAGKEIALLFGRESRGLTNEELQACHYHVNIPTNPEYGVLNVAQAIQVLCYEIRMAWLQQQDQPVVEPKQMEVSYTRWDEDLASHAEMEHFFKHWEQTLIDIDFLDPELPRQMMTRTRRMFNRIRMDQLELSMIRGVLSAIQKKIKP